MKDPHINPWRKVIDITLIILCWLTIAPLMYFPNRKQGYLKKRWLVCLYVISPFTWGILTFLFLLFGVPVLTAQSPAFASTISSFPEFTGAFSSTENWTQLLLISYLLPIYSFCVVVLFVSMTLTGWSYREASVQICEYYAPWVCIVLALTVIILIIAKWKKMTGIGKAASLIPIGMDGLMGIWNYEIYRMRVELYQGMTTDQIFNHAVEMLISLGKSTHTDYITANIIVYILPPITIVLIAYLGWIVYTVNRRE